MESFAGGESNPNKDLTQEPSSNVWRYLPFPPNKLILKEVLQVTEPTDASACQRRPQSPEMTGSSAKDNCGIAVSKVYEQIKDSVAQVMARPSSKPSFGSATLVCRQNCYYVTNHHVAQDAKALGIFSPDHKNIRYGKIVAIDAEKDLALALPPEPAKGNLKFGPRPQVGDKVFSVGHPYGSPYDVISVGQVGAVSKDFLSADYEGKPKQYKDLIASDIAVLPGNSGGPEFNALGQLVGIKVVAKGLEESGSIPVQDVLDLIDKYEKGAKGNG